jgi:CRISPR-associated endonuclease/helicase Cas3
MKHRTDTLARINTCLKSKKKMVCISTQLVEAGVDFSFESDIQGFTKEVLAAQTILY